MGLPDSGRQTGCGVLWVQEAAVWAERAGKRGPAGGAQGAEEIQGAGAGVGILPGPSWYSGGVSLRGLRVSEIPFKKTFG